MIRAFAIFTATFFTAQAAALDLDTPFQSMSGGTISIAQWHGQPVLVVNTASMCAFSGQYRDLQDLYDRYRDQGLIVLAIPSDDFKQELATNAEVKNFCELQYGIDMPMTKLHVSRAQMRTNFINHYKKMWVSRRVRILTRS